MDDLRKYIKKIQGLNLNNIIAEVLRDVKIQDYIIDLNQEEQLFKKGVGVDGQKLTPPYVETYKKKKASLGLPTSHISLYLYGGYYDGWTIFIGKDYFQIMAPLAELQRGFSLTDFLTGKYGDYQGLTTDSLDKLRQKITPAIMRIFEKKLSSF